MGNIIAWCHQQLTQGNRITSDEVNASNSRRRSEHFVFLEREEQARPLGGVDTASRDITRGRTLMFVGDKGVIYS